MTKMPAGNDTAGLALENEQRFGQEFLNAENLIRANNARYDPALQKILGRGPRPGDEDATNAVLSELEKYEDRFDLREGETLVSAGVHGDALVGLIEDAAGRHRKAIAPYTDSFRMPQLTAEEQQQVERAKVDSDVAAETDRIRREADERVRRAQEQAEREADEAIRRIKADAAAKVDAAAADAELPAARDLPEERPLPGGGDGEAAGSENVPVSPEGGDGGAQMPAVEAIAVADAAREADAGAAEKQGAKKQKKP